MLIVCWCKRADQGLQGYVSSLAEATKGLQKVMSFHRYVIDVCKANDYALGQIGNIDESPTSKNQNLMEL